MLNVTVRIEKEGHDALMQQLIMGIPKVLFRIVLKLAVIGQRTMVEKAPHKTGNLHRSIFYVMAPDGQSATVGPHVKYAKYLEEGTGPSPGAYIPAIGKRLVNPPRGVHPGIKARPFVGPTSKELNAMAPEVIRVELKSLVSGIGAPA